MPEQVRWYGLAFRRVGVGSDTREFWVLYRQIQDAGKFEWFLDAGPHVENVLTWARKTLQDRGERIIGITKDGQRFEIFSEPNSEGQQPVEEPPQKSARELGWVDKHMTP